MSTFLTSPLAPPPPLAGSRSVLVVDDEPGIRAALTIHFEREGWLVTSASGVREAEYRLSQRPFDLLVSDVRLPDGVGSDLLRSAHAEGDTPVVLLTAFGTVPDAVAAIRSGASDYLMKPVAWKELHAIAERLTETAGKFADPVADGFSGGIVGRSPALLAALSRARAAARTDADVLIEAESGTGKELLAQFIHDGSDRAGKPFVTVNCATVPGHLLESELFGHARGAAQTGAAESRQGRFELANGGTLLLDEVGALPLHLQPKLLRSLQERQFEGLGESGTVQMDIRVIATSNVPLASAVDEGRFRSDLYYRLNILPLTMPALRERVQDIPLLATFFAASWAAAAHRPAPVLTPEFLEEMEGRAWPGNVRELGNFMRRVLSLHDIRRDANRNASRAGAVLDRACFLREAGRPVNLDLAEPFAGESGPVPIRQLERLHLEKTLAMTRGNRTHAAEMLGISLRTMRNKIREYGLPPRRYA